MIAALVAVGSELVGGVRRDTNGDWLTDRIDRLGGGVWSRTAVVDDAALIARAIRNVAEGADLVVVTGGLGPTEDDRTREALARCLGRPLERDPIVERDLAAMFETRGRPFGPLQARQADRPAGTAWIKNRLGSAPGILARADDTLIAALPGVPGEMKAMFLEAVEPLIAPRASGAVARRTIKVAGRTEASVDEQVRDLYLTPGTESTILASPTGIELHLLARGGGREENARRLAVLEDAVRGRLGDDVFGVDDETLPGVVGAMLAARRRTVATAESCTGGLVGAAITDRGGASAWYRGGLVVYANDLKETLAGVSGDLLATHGAVSAPVAAALADGARTRCGADYGLGVTGIAGPTGGTAEKPVGLVYAAVASDGGTETARICWIGDRALVRARAVTLALDLLRRVLAREGTP